MITDERDSATVAIPSPSDPRQRDTRQMRMVAQSAPMHKHTVGPPPPGWVTVAAARRKGLMITARRPAVLLVDVCVPGQSVPDADQVVRVASPARSCRRADRSGVSASLRSTSLALTTLAGPARSNGSSTGTHHTAGVAFMQRIPTQYARSSFADKLLWSCKLHRMRR
jgi:hypothetical protein